MRHLAFRIQRCEVPQAISIFVLPPSIAALRGAPDRARPDAEEVIAKRVAVAREI